MTDTVASVHQAVRSVALDTMGTAAGLDWLEERLEESRKRAKRAEKMGFAVALPLSLLFAFAIVAVFPEAVERNHWLVLLALIPAAFQALDVVLRLIEVRRIRAFLEMARIFDDLAAGRE